MANLNSLIFTAAEYKIILLINDIPHPLLTVQDFGANAKVDDESIYAVGQEDPIGEKSTGTVFSGKMSLQNGELAAILLTHGLSNATQIRGAQLGITSLNGVYKKIYSGVNITNEDFSVKAKDKQTTISLDWKAVSQK